MHLRDDDGIVHTFQRHRVIAMLYLDKPSVENIVVNHLNGIRGDDRADNLEWTTYQGNAEHAGMMGLTDKCKPVSLRNIETKEITHYPSAVSCARANGLTKDAVLFRCKQPEARVYPDGNQYRFRDDEKEWEIPNELNTFGRSMPVLLFDTQTEEEMSFEKQSDLARFLGRSLSSITQYVKSGTQRLLDKRYLIKLTSDPTPWRNDCNPYTESKSTKAVVVINVSDGSETIYESAKICAMKMGIKPTTLNERLNRDGTKEYDGYRFKRYMP